ncbi:MAG: family N-acetyltransferase [Microbacteriaceae bacterium]|nr:family N-acetyltransferase [Microbacteriaceae bacterium]
MSITVRQAVAADAEALHGVAVATFALACPPGTTQAAIDAFIASVLSIDRFDEYLADSTRELFVAVADGTDGEFAGYTMLVYGEPADADVAATLSTRPTVELSKCYVLPSGHGQGIAASLLAATLESARARGAAAAWLGVNQHNARANRFYEKNGFVQVGTKHFLVGSELHDDFTRELVFAR